MITPDELFSKSKRALQSAQLLLDEQDTDGACNRAYYAMFDAARAALLYAKYEEAALSSKTHNGLITAFSLHLVKTEKLPIELGRSLNKVEDLRLIADYLGDPVDFAQAKWAVEKARLFLAGVGSFISE